MVSDTPVINAYTHRLIGYDDESYESSTLYFILGPSEPDLC